MYVFSLNRNEFQRAEVDKDPNFYQINPYN